MSRAREKNPREELSRARTQGEHWNTLSPSALTSHTPSQGRQMYVADTVSLRHVLILPVFAVYEGGPQTNKQTEDFHEHALFTNKATWNPGARKQTFTNKETCSQTCSRGGRPRVRASGGCPSVGVGEGLRELLLPKVVVVAARRRGDGGLARSPRPRPPVNRGRRCACGVVWSEVRYAHTDRCTHTHTH